MMDLEIIYTDLISLLPIPLTTSIMYGTTHSVCAVAPMTESSTQEVITTSLVLGSPFRILHLNTTTHSRHGRNANARCNQRHLGSSNRILRTLAIESRLPLSGRTRKMGPICLCHVQQRMWNGYRCQGWQNCRRSRARS
jgi:hypothetical protein